MRDLEWDGCVNVRDLGGLPTVDGRRLRRGAVVRSDHPSRLTASGWAALRDHGVRTIVSLQTELTDPGSYSLANPPLRASLVAGLEGRVIHLQDGDDAEFATRWLGTGLTNTPVFFPDSFARWPDRYAAALRAVASAPDGGVVVHCAGGCDRTGSVVLLLLALLGVQPEAVAADYLRSRDRVHATDPDYIETADRALADAGLDPGVFLAELLDGLDADAVVRSGGLTDLEIDALRDRLL